MSLSPFFCIKYKISAPLANEFITHFSHTYVCVMNSIFELDKFQDYSTQLDLDELFEKKQQYDQQQLDLYNKMLAKIHTRIKTISRQNVNQQYCWYVVPEQIFGVPRYNQASCIAYVIDQLKTNGLSVRYIHPNTIYICWKHLIPSYVRNQIKLKTGIVIDEFGKVVEKKKEIEDEDGGLFAHMESSSSGSSKRRGGGGGGSGSGSGTAGTGGGGGGGVSGSEKKYKPINTYKPTGNLIYDNL